MRYFIAMLVAVLITLATFYVRADDQDFDWVKPFDQKVTDALVWDNETQAAKISDFTQLSMSILPFFSAIGKEDGWQRVAGLGAAHGTSVLLTHIAKQNFDRVRPNGQGTRSFWSGHTSASFVGAGYLCVYEKRFCATGLALAGTTGYLRIAGRRHWFTDVLVGAAIGYMSGRQIPILVMEF